jgi:L-ribulose-5-phosphate 3-epimerase
MRSAAWTRIRLDAAAGFGLKSAHQIMTPSIKERLAVCSWSLQPNSPQQLLEHLRAIGIPRMQFALDLVRENPAVWGPVATLCQQNGVTIVSGMFGTVGEDYSSLDSIRHTGGVVPDATWDQNWQNIQAVVKIARELRLKLVSFHAGFLPHEESDPAYQKLRDRILRIADLFAAQNIDLAFETGQETAGTLRAFLEKLGRKNVGVNFDPANMILYDKGDPIQALRVLGPWVRQVHLKDANRTQVTGTWGEEVVVGTGQVDWKAFFQVLAELNFGGHGCIEREAGNQRVPDIRAARQYVESLN